MTTLQARMIVTSTIRCDGSLPLAAAIGCLQADIFKRFQRMNARECVHLIVDDTSGPATVKRARIEGRSEAELADELVRAHARDLDSLGIVADRIDHPYTEASRVVADDIWAKLGAAGLVVEQEVGHLYDPTEATFVDARVAVGDCPRCGEREQRGDGCANCGASYHPLELLGARSSRTGAVLSVRPTTQLRLKVEHARAFLLGWTQMGLHLEPELSKQILARDLGAALEPCDVSRPRGGLGLEIPGHPSKSWSDELASALGYLGLTKAWCDERERALGNFWRSNEASVVHLVSGEEATLRVHTLHWPALLHATGFRAPSMVRVRGRLADHPGAGLRTARVEGPDASHVRYVVAAGLGATGDAEIDTSALGARVDGDLVARLRTLAARLGGCIDRLPGAYPDDGGLFAESAAESASIAEAYMEFDTRTVVGRVLALTDRALAYAEERGLGSARGDANSSANVATVAANLLRQIAIYVAPVLPSLAADVAAFVGAPTDAWELAQRPSVGATVAPVMRGVAGTI